jgi:glycosyltransferase involved in cell wall biosynthesis
LSACTNIENVSLENIIIIGPAHPIRPGGITTFNERLCKAFSDEGHHCSIWSFSLQYPTFLFPGSSQFTDGPAPQNISIHTAINSINPLNWIRVGRQIKKLKPDLVVVRYWIPFMGPCLGTILRIIKQNKHTQVVCLADNVIPHEHRPGDALFTRYFVKPVDRFTVMSKQVLQDLKTFTNKPVQLLPHPLYDNFGMGETTPVARDILQKKFKLSINTEDKLLVFFGLVRQYKGLDLLIEALSETRDTTIKLLVAGEFYDAERPYLEQVKTLGLQNRIILYNRFIEGADVKHFICAAECIIQPYKSATQSGVTPVAYNFQVPMIVTNVGGLPEMVPHQKAGIVCEPNANDIAKAIDEYFIKGKSSFMTGLLDEKKKLSWERMVAALIGSKEYN